MKRDVVMKLFFTAVVFAFLLTGIFAAAPAPNTCAITTRADCPETEGFDGTHILMGLSSATNAHGEFPDTGLYSHVLCCAFGDGMNDTECDTGATMIKLSSATNAHAENPTGTVYNTVKVCYNSNDLGDLKCDSFADSCPASNPIGILSLSATTNAHVGAIGDYATKICCGSALLAGCEINSARWSPEDAVEGQNINLIVQGNAACSGKTIAFAVDGGSDPVQSQPIPVSFTGTEGVGVWEAEHQTVALLFDADYYFDASLLKNPLVVRESSPPELLVSKRNTDYCAEITSCDDYINELDCESDNTICNVAEESSPGIDCNSDSFVCGCTWDTEEGTCGFGYTEITEATCGNPVAGEGCEYGCTLCHDAEGNYCHVGSSCPSGENPLTNSNGSCDFGIDGCVSADCQDGEQDTCVSGLYCVAGKCSSVLPPITLELGSCKITQTITKNCDDEPVGDKIATLTTEWTGPDGPGKTACEAKNGQTVKILCPAQVQLPFFDYIGIITTVLAVVGIYVAMVFKKKFGKKDKQ